MQHKVKRCSFKEQMEVEYSLEIQKTIDFRSLEERTSKEFVELVKSNCEEKEKLFSINDGVILTAYEFDLAFRSVRVYKYFGEGDYTTSLFSLSQLIDILKVFDFEISRNGISIQ